MAEIPWNRNYFFLKGSGPAQRTEAPVAETPAGLEGGYTQTKWVAERIVTEAMKRNVPVTISRPGRITGHSNYDGQHFKKFSTLQNHWGAIFLCVSCGSAKLYKKNTKIKKYINVQSHCTLLSMHSHRPLLAMWFHRVGMPCGAISHVVPSWGWRVMRYSSFLWFRCVMVPSVVV